MSDTLTPRTSGSPNVHASVVRSITVTLVSLGLLLVVSAPVVMSAHSLAGWGRDKLDLSGAMAYGVPATLDAAALVCVGLTFHAMLRGDSAGVARLLVWAFAGASSWANWRHGHTISTDAAVYYGSMPLVAALLLDIALRRVRRVALAEIGALERPLPRFRAVRWAVDPVGTWRAWSTGVREGITDPMAALEASRRPPVDLADLDPEDESEDDVPDLPSNTAEVVAVWRESKKAALQLAFERLGEIDGGKAAEYLAQRGLSVTSNYAYDVAAKERRRQQESERPALTAVASSGD